MEGCGVPCEKAAADEITVGLLAFANGNYDGGNDTGSGAVKTHVMRRCEFVLCESICREMIESSNEKM